MGLKRAREVAKGEDENDSDFSGGDDGDSSSFTSSKRDSRRDSALSSTSTLIHDLPCPPSSSTSTTNTSASINAGSPCLLLRSVTPPPPSPLAPNFKFPAITTTKRESGSYASPFTENDHEDEDGTRSPKRRRMSKELDGDNVCLNLNLNTGEGDADMEVEMDGGEDGWHVVSKDPPVQTKGCDVVVKEECVDDMDMKDKDGVGVKSFTPPVCPTTTTTVRSNISISHIDLLYQATPDRMICRMCLYVPPLLLSIFVPPVLISPFI
jgi:hypothetical protein